MGGSERQVGGCGVFGTGAKAAAAAAAAGSRDNLAPHILGYTRACIVRNPASAICVSRQQGNPLLLLLLLLLLLQCSR